ncbi:hypothetical protein [Pseudomonas chlororaphis]|uniref:hypothetical protein n=1 Tax=Pseudomonas chlororaphis TaxID=587753 RepID=UPI0012DA5DE1|nr:hypothetical protein [Pseudomonas chlororaphis]
MSAACKKQPESSLTCDEPPAKGANLFELAKLLPLLSVMCRINSWEEANLPTPPTLAGKDLFVRIAANSVGQEMQSLKVLYWDSNHASSGMRKSIRQLEQEGWLRRVPSSEDMRRRVLVATEKLQVLVADYLRVLSDHVMEASSVLQRINSSLPQQRLPAAGKS